jgi:hypothetical protein
LVKTVPPAAGNDMGQPRAPRTSATVPQHQPRSVMRATARIVGCRLRRSAPVHRHRPRRLL